MKKRFSKICKRIAAFAAALIVGLPTTASLVPVSAADKLVNEYDETRVVDDLGSATMVKLAAQATTEHKDAAPSLYTMAEIAIRKTKKSWRTSLEFICTCITRRKSKSSKQTA